MLNRLIAPVVLVLVSGCAQSAPTPTPAAGLKPVDGALLSLSPAALSAPEDVATPFAPAGPLFGVVMAAGIDERGRPIKPGIAFSSASEKVTAIIPVGEVTGAEVLSVTWFRLAGPGERERLFEHEIPIDAFVDAYSVGVSDGPLLQGAYVVVASLGDHEVWVPWFVQAASDAAALDAEEAAPPAPGASGTNPWHDEAAAEPAGQAQDAACLPLVSAEPSALVIEASALVFSDCRRIALAGRVQGGEAVLIAEGGPTIIDRFHPCQLPGGSDLPGTVFEFGAWEVPAGPEANDVLELPDFGEWLETEILSDPPPGSTVSPGQTIRFEVHTLSLMPGWGLRLVEVGGPEGVIDRDERGDPVPCDPGRHYSILSGTYTVPPDPPETIDLRAVALDQKDRTAEFTAQYFVRVPGTWTGRVTYAWADVPQDPTAREFDVHNFRDGQADVTLREVPSPLVLDGKVVGEQIQLDETGTIVTEQSRQQGTIPSHVCDGEGTGKIARGGFFSRIVRKTEAVDLKGILGFDVPVGESYYWIWPDATAIEPPTFHFRCESRFEDDASFFLFTIGNLQPGTVSPGLDPELRALTDDGKRMEGTWTWREGPDSLTVTWDLVRAEPGG